MTWPVVRFGEIVKFRNGLNYSRENFGCGLKIISVGNFGNRFTPDLDALQEINPEGVATAEDYLMDGDLLFVRSNGNRDLVGRAMLINGISDSMVSYSGFCIRARFLNTATNPTYYAYLFRDSRMRHKLTSGGVGANIANVSQKTLAKLEVPMPPRKIQDAVVAILSAYDDLIATNQRRIALLEQAARSLYREWFVHLRFPGHEAVPVNDGVPKGWCAIPLRSIATLNYGKALKAVDRKDGDVPVYGSSGIVGAHNQALVPAGAIVIGRKGNVGSLYLSQVPCYPIDTVFYIEPDQVSLWLFLALHQLNFISSDSAVPGLNRNYAHSLPLLHPTVTLRESFQQLVAPMYEQVNLLLRQSEQTARARDLLLPKLMSGQIDVSQIPLPAAEVVTA
jgi:type I restriction enzyme S subunit